MKARLKSAANDWGRDKHGPIYPDLGQRVATMRRNGADKQSLGAAILAAFRALQRRELFCSYNIPCTPVEVPQAESAAELLARIRREQIARLNRR